MAPELSYELERDCPRCQHCDDMGDVHRADGEWVGVCSCAAGDRIRGQARQSGLDARDALRYRWLREWAGGRRMELFQTCATKSELDAAIDAELVKAGWIAPTPGVKVDLSAFRQGNWQHPDHIGRIVGWIIPNDAVQRMGADAYVLPREVEDALTRLATAHGKAK